MPSTAISLLLKQPGYGRAIQILYSDGNSVFENESAKKVLF